MLKHQHRDLPCVPKFLLGRALLGEAPASRVVARLEWIPTPDAGPVKQELRGQGACQAGAWAPRAKRGLEGGRSGGHRAVDAGVGRAFPAKEATARFPPRFLSCLFVYFVDQIPLVAAPPRSSPLRFGLRIIPNQLMIWTVTPSRSRRDYGGDWYYSFGVSVSEPFPLWPLMAQIPVKLPSLCAL